MSDEDSEATPLLAPADGVPEMCAATNEIAAAAAILAKGSGPFAVDAERASGFRYSNRAYLIQIRRAGAGTVLIDPVSHGADPLTALRPVAEVLAGDEWILHSADQDLPCLAEVGMRPAALYDTELAGRLVQAPVAHRMAQLRGPGCGIAHPAACRDFGCAGRARQNGLGRRGIRLSADLQGGRCRRRACTGCAT